MYGLEIPEIKDSPGLNVDIAFITAFHTRFVLDAIARTLTSGRNSCRRLNRTISYGEIAPCIPSPSTLNCSASRFIASKDASSARTEIANEIPHH